MNQVRTSIIIKLKFHTKKNQIPPLCCLFLSRHLFFSFLILPKPNRTSHWFSSSLSLLPSQFFSHWWFPLSELGLNPKYITFSSFEGGKEKDLSLSNLISNRIPLLTSYFFPFYILRLVVRFPPFIFQVMTPASLNVYPFMMRKGRMMRLKWKESCSIHCMSRQKFWQGSCRFFPFMLSFGCWHVGREKERINGKLTLFAQFSCTLVTAARHIQAPIRGVHLNWILSVWGNWWSIELLTLCLGTEEGREKKKQEMVSNELNVVSSPVPIANDGKAGCAHQWVNGSM